MEFYYLLNCVNLKKRLNIFWLQLYNMKVIIGLNLNIDASLIPMVQTVAHKASNAKVFFFLILGEYINGWSLNAI